ncbi:MAG: protoporphyrinogen oxidase [Chloroflexota bacterium]
MEKNIAYDLIVVGGGIAGLSAAYAALHHTRQAAKPPRVLLLDSAAQWGGKISTDRVPQANGEFVIEGGPDTFLATKPDAKALCDELGIGDSLQGTNPHQRNTYVLHNGRLTPLPDGLAMMIPTNFASMAATRLLSWPQKARMGLDFVLPPRPLNGDESLGAFVSRRLGRAAYENLIEPLMSGIYAGDGDRLSLAATFPYLRDMEIRHGGLVKGALAMKRQAAASGRAARGSRSAFLTPKTGLAAVVEALLRDLRSGGADLRLNAAVLRIAHHDSSYLLHLAGGETLTAAAVILATPAYASADILAGLDPALAGELRSIPYVSTATVSLAYRHEDLPRPLDGYGYVIPRREGRQALACTWTSTKFPHRAPEGYALLRVFIGRAGQDIAWNETDLLAVARQELVATLGIHAPSFLSRVFVWEKAMPQYNLGHPQRLVNIENALRAHPGLALAGNGYRGIGIPDCIRSGQLAVEQVLPRLPETMLTS